MPLNWIDQINDVDWLELAQLYKIAPLGDKKADELQQVFSSSLYTLFVYDQSTLVAAGRVLADGLDCAYICDVAVHPDYQGHGLGKQLIHQLVSRSQHHKKIILYANPGKEGFYQKLGFKFMNTAMALFRDEQKALETGLVRKHQHAPATPEAQDILVGS